MASALRARKAKAEVTPVDQVISLLEDLQTQTEEEGDEEAKTYDSFACFCKDTTQEKSEAIQNDQTEIDTQSATAEEKDTLRIDLEKEIDDLNNLIAQIGTDMADAERRRDVENTKYEATAADLANAVSNVNEAIESVKSSGGTGASLATMKTSVRKALVVSDVLEISPKHQRTLNALLQEEDDGVPESDYSSHGNDLTDLMNDLAKRYADKKSKVDEEEAAAVSAHTAYMASKTAQKETAEGDLDTKKADLSQCIMDLGAATEALTTAKAMLTDDETYMKDLTAKCEMKAKEWDQRSKMRADELTALSQALAVMQDRVKAKSDQANKRALLQNDAPDAAPAKAEDKEDVDDDDVGDVSFLQVEKSPRHRIGSLLKQAQARHAEKAKAEEVQEATTQTKQTVKVGTKEDRVLELLRSKSLKLKSPILSSLAMKMAADPFVKVKKLLQELVERLVTEAADEASQKGFCDTELGKARSSRNTEHTHVSKFNAAAYSLEASRDLLQDEIAQLTTELAELNDSLTTTTNLRSQEKEENLDTITKATEGLDAVTEAIGILSNFYKGAAKGKVLLQVSPVDEANADRASGAYKGNQGASGNIIGLMEVIKSDFERTIKTTKEAEYNASREFAEFDTTTKSSISSKETSKAMKEADLTKANADLTQAMADLSEHMTMLDDSLLQLESLKPACIDTGMSYSDRVAKREEEIEALKTAMCMLDTDGVEDGC